MAKVKFVELTSSEYIRQGFNLLEVPVELKDRFELDMQSALMNIAGISISNSTRFIQYEKLAECYHDNHINPFKVNTLTIGMMDSLQLKDFFDPSVVSPEIYSRPIFIHLDLSVNGDKTGIGAVAVMGYKNENRYSIERAETETTKELYYHHIFSCRIQAPTTDEISMQKTRDFIYYLKYQLGWNIWGVSTDGFQCLPSTALIKTSNGDKRIVDLSKDDKVLSFDIEGEQYVWTDFTNLRQTGVTDKLYKISTPNGIIECTRNHPILTDRGYVRADELLVTDRIMRCKLIHIWEDDWNNDKDKFIKYMHDEIFNYVPITKIECVDVEKQPVYDIEVPKFNNFTLSNGLVVHNSVDMRQSLKLAGFENVDLVSLDRSPDGYITYKYAINEQRIAHLNIPELEYEIINLARDNQTGKVDHDADKCFTGDTKVKLVDGRDLSILELMKEQEYKTNWVYTINESTHKIEPKPIKKVFQTMITKDLVKITLDNGESVTCTPNHRFMLRDGTYTQANKLSAGTSLMPIYTKVSDIKVASVEFIKSPCRVYDLEIEDNHNFGLTCGVFVHNSKDEADGICGAVYNAYLHAQDLNLYLSDCYDIVLDVNEETFVDSDGDNILQNLISTTLPYENKSVTYTPSMLENIIDNSSNNDDGFFFL